MNSEKTSHRESDELFVSFMGLNFYRQSVQIMHSSSVLTEKRRDYPWNGRRNKALSQYISWI